MNNAPTYWVACSGGVDSIVLLHLMLETKNKNEVGILHCNFHLREQSSNEDELFVRNLARELNVPIRVQDFDTKQYAKSQRLNTQLAARELRYNWFDQIIREEQAVVLLGHHYDDQLETFFLQLRRGGRVKGLSGMPEYRAGYLRPLLKHTKEELISLAQQHDWKWREDVTNASNDYTRNWYRNEVLPCLQSEGFPIHEVVPLMHSFQSVLCFLKSIKIPDSILIEDWKSYPVWVQQHILSEQGLGEYAVDEIARLTKSEKGKFIGNDHAKVWNEGDALVFVKESSQAVEYKLAISKHPTGTIKLNPSDLFLDTSKVKLPLTIRKWQAGDYFQPLGMKGLKSVGKFLRDRKVPAHQKEQVRILLDSENHILGVFGFGVDEKYRLNNSTKELFRVRLIKM
nr:tRNA lysidine(34) synthetase TilS [uncultured Brumimicrobium sp.]